MISFLLDLQYTRSLVEAEVQGVDIVKVVEKVF